MKKALANMKISRKLIVAFLLISLFSLVVGATGIMNALLLSNAGTKLYEVNTMGVSYIGQAAGEFQQLRYNALEMTTFDLNKQSRERAEKLEGMCNSVTELVQKYGDTLSKDNTESLVLYEKTLADWDKYVGFIDKAVLLVEQDKNDLAAGVIIEESSITGDILWESFSQLSLLSADDAGTTSKSNSLLAITMIIVMLAVVIVGLVFSIIIGRFFAGLIGKPLNKMAEAADKLALGDLNVEIEVTTNDEIGLLARAFGTVVESTRKQALAAEQIASGDMTVHVEVRSENDLLGKKLSELVDDLNDLLSGIATSAGQVSEGSRQVSDSSMALSQGAAAQASSVEELTVSLDQIAAQTKLNAHNANQAKELAENTMSDASQGNNQMNEMLMAMDEINKSSTGISKIIKVIDNIAFQTNILALNAAVEAARAGSAGKGFSVVAEEVKNLAQKSATAANETTAMIENSIKKVQDGTKIANATAEALNSIVIKITKAVELISKIAVASNEQAAGIEQINKGIMQVSHVVQANSATSEESASASEELSSQAEMLTEMVGKFKLRNNEQPEEDSDEFDTELLSLPEGKLQSAKPTKAPLNEPDLGKYR